MIKIYNFDVGQADCILVHFEKDNKYFNLLVDGALIKDDIDSKLKDKLGDKQKIQGIVVTHIDADHINGIVDLFKKQNNSGMIENAFVLFNKFDPNLISYNRAEEFERIIEKNFANNILIKSYEQIFSQELMDKINADTECLGVKIRSINQRSMEESIDCSIVNITILGPTIENIKKLMCNWEKHCTNPEITNRSSIMLLLEFGEKAIVLSGDGYFCDINEELQKIGNLKKINVVKAAHHGAEKNNAQLLQTIEKYKVEHVFFTIDETKYNQKKEHPSSELLEKLSEIELTCSNHLDETKTEDDSLKKYLKQKLEIELRD